MIHTTTTTKFSSFFIINLNKTSLRHVGKSAKAHLEVTPMLDEIIIGSMLGGFNSRKTYSN
jgi:hypothetical protein